MPLDFQKILGNPEQKLWRSLNALSPRAHRLLIERRLLIAYLIAGGSAVLVDVGALYFFKGILGFSLIPAVALAFMAGFCASFLLQKFWTFGDLSVARVHAQAAQYFILAAVNFFLNLGLMYVLVELAGLWYILAKILVSGAIACGSFFVYKYFIFKRRAS